ncbi:MAG: YajQ family cyclic di-GMP-binding protein [Deltaproteobacteria bacterium]|nr:YajQ family cyclic di-GMP-binding protein [Deltaproteobacteria bacterium]
MPSFDIVSKVQWAEVDNALNQAEKEIGQRFDFRGTDTSIEKTDAGIVIKSSSEDRVNAALSVFQEKLVKRKVSLKFLDVGDPKPTSKGGAQILVKVKEGVEAEPARKIIGAIKDSKLKVQSSIQDAQVRVTGKNKDDLQKAIALVRGLDLGIELSFVNFRN